MKLKDLKFLAKKDKSTQAIYAAAFIVIAFGAYGYFSSASQLKGVRSELATKENRIKELELSLENSKNENMNLTDALIVEQSKMKLFEDQIKQITGAVSGLEKLSKTDPQLLQKYSKIYFLNEHYVPSDVKIINPEYLYNKDNSQLIHGGVVKHLDRMMNNAKSSNIDLKIVSAYRSFGTQSSLKSSYKVTYGSGANKFSADQGYSEHQLGTTLDFTTSESGAAFTNFEKTDAYEWLKGNAYKFGFILSYPQNNDYYIFEPWHWRFVGVSLAIYLYENNISFYDLDQREIDKYLVQIFD